MSWPISPSRASLAGFRPYDEWVQRGSCPGASQDAPSGAEPGQVHLSAAPLPIPVAVLLASKSKSTSRDSSSSPISEAEAEAAVAVLPSVPSSSLSPRS